MVRMFLPPRFSKNRMSATIADQALSTFGGPTLFRNSRVIHSTACYLNKNNQLCTINLQAGAPYCPQDFWVLQFLRTYADCIVTTGKTLRNEPEAFDTSLIKSMDFDPLVYFAKPKPLAILTNTLNANLLEQGNAVYSDRKYLKHLLVKDTSLKRFEEHEPRAAEVFSRGNMTLEGIEGLNLRRAIDYLRKEYRYEMTLVECGASTTVQCYSETHRLQGRKAPPIDFQCDGNPIDTLYLGIFEGTLMPPDNVEQEESVSETSFIGQPFINMDWLMSQYNLVHVNEPDKQVYNFAGTCTQTFWRKKSAAELDKLREKSKGLRLVNHESDSWQNWTQQSDYYKAKVEAEIKSDKQKKPEHASRSVDFERKRYPWLSDKMFSTKKPKV